MPDLKVRSERTSYRNGIAIDVGSFALQTLLHQLNLAHPNEPYLCAEQKSINFGGVWMDTRSVPTETKGQLKSAKSAEKGSAK